MAPIRVLIVPNGAEETTGYQKRAYSSIPYRPKHSPVGPIPHIEFLLVLNASNQFVCHFCTFLVFFCVSAHSGGKFEVIIPGPLFDFLELVNHFEAQYLTSWLFTCESIDFSLLYPVFHLVEYTVNLLVVS